MAHLLFQSVKVIDDDSNEQVQHEEWTHDDESHEKGVRHQIVLILGLQTNLWERERKKQNVWVKSTLADTTNALM